MTFHECVKSRGNVKKYGNGIHFCKVFQKNVGKFENQLETLNFVRKNQLIYSVK